MSKGTFANCRARVQYSKILHENYLAVTLGQPRRHGVTENVDVLMEKIPDKLNMNDKMVIEPVLSRDLMSRYLQWTSEIKLVSSSDIRLLSHSQTLSEIETSGQPSHFRLIFVAPKAQSGLA